MTTNITISLAAPSAQSPAAQSPGCRRCETVPEPPAGPGTLHLRFPLGHTLGKVVHYLGSIGREHSCEQELLSITVGENDLSSVAEELCRQLTSSEQADVRVIFQQVGQVLQWQSLFEAESLQRFAAQTQSGWLVALIEEERLTTWFQPIVECKNPSSIFAYECLMRGHANGQLVFPNKILEVARGAGLLFQMDRAARLASIRNASHFALSQKIFINFTPTSVYDPKNCLQTTMKAVDESDLKREQVVFEVIESDDVGDANFLRDILNFYRDQGFGVALDDLGSGYSSLNMISRLRPDYIKLDRELIQNVHDDPYKALIARKLLETARELKVETIAEGVETREEYKWLCENGANYVQGYFFARPASPPPLPARVD